MPLRTYTFTPSFVEREMIGLTTEVEFDQSGFIHRFDRSQRPSSRFRFSLGPLTRTEADCLWAIYSLHGSTKSFFLQGIFSSFDNYQTVGEGDDDRRDFFLFNRYVNADSATVRTLDPGTQATSTAANTTIYPTGLIRTDTAPASGDLVQAIWACDYRVRFGPEPITIQNPRAGIYLTNLNLIEIGFNGFGDT